MNVKEKIRTKLITILQNAGNQKNKNWYKDRIGGKWEEMGQKQLDFLIKNDLQPHHRLLDIGCGSLRGGVKFIEYLEHGNYGGVDIDRDILEAAEMVLEEAGLAEKEPHIYHTSTFDFSKFKEPFDYAIAQSVFSHVSLNNIIMCVMRVEKALVAGGQFYATFYENPEGKFNLDPVRHEGYALPTYFNKDGFHYDFSTFEWVVDNTSLKVEYIGDWGHARGQKMLKFTKST